jgi:alpha-N-arabinofuranosidase
MTPLARPALAAIVVALAICATSARSAEIRFSVRDRVLHRIDPRMFGQFMERASWAGEIGAEAGLMPGTRRLQPEALGLLREMDIPIIRFPGGTDVDFLDWRDMIDNVPGRGQDRPLSRGHKGGAITNNFGYDEFLRLAEDLGAEIILVVNLRNGLLNIKPVREAAREAASLVAYCNAPVGAELPDGMQDWPAVRARNGRVKPYGVKYFQLGNETWAFLKQMRTRQGADAEKLYVACLEAYVEAMRSVDPSIRIITDGQPDPVPRMLFERLGDNIQYLVFHLYRPWGISAVTRDGNKVEAADLTEREIWYAWVATPNIDDRGCSSLANPTVRAAQQLGYKVAVTEWNWNGGWWSHPPPRPLSNSWFAKGVGAAGFIHALMRAGHTIEIGCQSMLVGKGWDITAIHVDPQAKSAPFFMPSGQVTMLYSKHHGDALLDVEADYVPTYAQPYAMGGIRPAKKVAYVDALATKSEDAVYFHAINRHFDEPLWIVVDLSDFAGLTGTVVHHVLEGRLNNAPGPGEPLQVGRLSYQAIELKGRSLRIALPRRSVSCVEIKRRPGQPAG